jgi:GTP cyclohydrolase I
LAQVAAVEQTLPGLQVQEELTDQTLLCLLFLRLAAVAVVLEAQHLGQDLRAVPVAVAAQATVQRLV